MAILTEQILRPVRVLIVDDSRTIRTLLRALLAQDGRIEVVGEAGDPYEAREQIKALNPDVLTLDVEMPRMNGLVFLEKLMRLRPMPVVMVSTRTAEQSDAAVRALSLGAIDCVDLRRLQEGDRRVQNVAETIVTASHARLRLAPASAPDPGGGDGAAYAWNGRFVVIGSSTGGVDALLSVFSRFPKNCPPTIVAQHMPAHFLESFARRLDAHAAPRVRLAEDGDRLEPGLILLAAGGDHNLRIRHDRPPRIETVPAPADALYVPSVDTLFSSAVPAGAGAVGVMLTGMGRDGADALLEMRRAGAHTIVQSGATAVVDGMPRAARERGAAVEVADLDRIAGRVLAVTGRGARSE